MGSTTDGIIARLEIVRCSDRKLEGVLLKCRRRIIQEVIDSANGKTKVMIDRESKAGAGKRRISICVIPRRSDSGLLVKENVVSERPRICLAETGSNELLVQARDLKALVDVVDAGLEIKLLINALQNNESQAAAIPLLQIEALGEAMVKNSLPEGEETRV